MKLEEVRGIQKPLADKLRRAGVHNAEELATADARKVRVPGVGEEKIRSLRREAQRALFEAAVRRVEQIADQAIVTVDQFIKEATKAAVAAAEEAQDRAQMALDAARRQTHALARIAATRTHQAARVAEREYRKLNRKLVKAEPAIREKLNHYRQGAQRATAAAKRASMVAREAALVAQRKAGVKAGRNGGRSKSLATRVRKQRGRPSR